MAKIAVIFCLVALMGFTGVAQASGGGNYHHIFWKIVQKLGLSDQQKAEAKAVFQANRAVVKPIVTSLRAERQVLFTLMNTDPVNEAAITAETAKIAGIQAQLNVNRAKVMAQFRAILTPVQLTNLNTLLQQYRELEGDSTASTTPSG